MGNWSAPVDCNDLVDLAMDYALSACSDILDSLSCCVMIGNCYMSSSYAANLTNFVCNSFCMTKLVGELCY